MMNLSKPKQIDFAIIGFPKCATTSIAMNLSSNYSNALYILPREPDHFEIQYFNFPEQKLIGLKNPEIIYHLHQWTYVFNSSTKFIVCIRDPVDQLFSYYQYRKMELEQTQHWKQTPMMTFNDILYNHAELLGCSLQHCKQDKYLATLLSIYSPQQILLVDFNEITFHFDTSFKRICLFLNLEVHEVVDSAIENINHFKTPLHLSEKDLKTLEDEFKETKQKLNQFLQENYTIYPLCTATAPASSFLQSENNHTPLPEFHPLEMADTFHLPYRHCRPNKF